MTIGPEPRTRILWRSSLRGMGLLDRADEVVEEPERVVRAGAGLGVVLDAAGGHVEQPDALDRPVVEVHVGQLRLPDVAREALARRAGDGEAVVLRGDGD